MRSLWIILRKISNVFFTFCKEQTKVFSFENSKLNIIFHMVEIIQAFLKLFVYRFSYSINCIGIMFTFPIVPNF